VVLLQQAPMSTKSTLRQLEEGPIFWEECLLCGGSWNPAGAGIRFWPKHLQGRRDICVWCWRRSKKALRMFRALDDIASMQCIGFAFNYRGATGRMFNHPDCKCATCYAGKVFDALFPHEYEDKPEPTEPEEEVQVSSFVPSGEAIIET
jgi:hypothetical protein